MFYFRRIFKEENYEKSLVYFRELPLLALNAVASEVQIKGGYDYYREFKSGIGISGDKGEKLVKGPTAGVEYLFDNQGEFEWGVGSEYKFSNNSSKLKIKKLKQKF